jgi:hypothetical protein
VTAPTGVDPALPACANAPTIRAVLPSSVQRALDEAASRWGISSRLATLLFAIPIIGSLLVIPFRLSRPAWVMLTSEDHILEWGQFGLFAVAGIVAAWVAVERWRSGMRWHALLFGAFALGLLFIAGEEISWGQRLFGFRTPDELDKINEQGETTLHNITGALASINTVMFLIGVVGTLLPIADRRYGTAAKLGHGADLFIPPMFLASAFATVAAFRFARATVLTGKSFTFGQYGEWSEFCLALAFAVYIILVLRRVRLAPHRLPASDGRGPTG